MEKNVHDDDLGSEEYTLASNDGAERDGPTENESPKSTSSPELDFSRIKIEFDGHNDPSNPLNWSPVYKWVLVVVLSLFGFISNLTIIIIAPAAPQILSELGADPRLSINSTVIVCVMAFGEMLGPLVIGPLSEIYGRLLPYHIANILFILFTAAGGLSRNLAMLVVFRLLAGLTIVAPLLNPPIAGDIFVQEKRGTAISVMAFTPLLGTVLAPVIGGYLTKAGGWRWTFWIIIILAGALEIALLFLLRETYHPKILKGKLSTHSDGEDGKSDHSKARKYNHDSPIDIINFTRSLLRPVRMLILSPVVALVSIYISLIYGYTYLIATSLTEVFESVYHFSEGPAGLTFLGISLGMITGVVFCGLTMDRYLRAKNAQGLGMKPEYRLLPMILGGFLAPAGLFMYGWTIERRVQWMVPILGTSLFAFGAAVCQVVSASYLVDAYNEHAASAVAATMFLRYLATGCLPLAGPPMYNKLGLGWGNSILGLVALVMVPAPLLMLRYGERLRGWEGKKRKY